MRCGRSILLLLTAVSTACTSKSGPQGPGGLYNATGRLDATGEVFQLVGGADHTGLRHEAWALDILHREWVRIDGPGDPLLSAASVRLDDTVWVFGGTSTSSTETADLVRWETRGGAWTDLGAAGQAPPPRREATFVPVSDSQAVLIGGNNDDHDDPGTTFGDVWGFDAADRAFTEVATTGGPAGLQRHAAAYDGGRVWVHGGIDADGNLSDTLWSLDTNTWAWTAIDTPEVAPEARADHFLAWWGSHLVLWGGGVADDQLWLFEPATVSWTAVASDGPSARDAFAWDVVDDEPWALVVGGDPVDTDGYESDVWVLNLATYEWTELMQLDGSSF